MTVKMLRKTFALLILSTLFNGALCFFLMVFALFATSPAQPDVTMRIGFYVLNFIAVTAFAATFLPWILTHRKRGKTAVMLGMLPLLLAALASVAFLLLDSWLNRNFAG